MSLRLTEEQYAAIKARQSSARSHDSTELAGSGGRASSTSGGVESRHAARVVEWLRSDPKHGAVGRCPTAKGLRRSIRHPIAGVASGPLTHSAPRSKFRSVKVDGYASKREAKRAAELRLLQEAGQIRNLCEQVKFPLIPSQPGERACSYTADFVYHEGEASAPRIVVEDCKGYRTEVYRIKRKLMLHVHGIRVRET